MITDNLDQINRYAIPKTETILKFIADHDCINLPVGEIEIQGRELFVRVMSYTPKPAAENRFEMHQVYADVQVLISGTEVMQIARMKDLTPLTEYDKQGDYLFFKLSGAVSDLTVQAGEFVVFYPGQAHRPGCAWEGYKGPVKKLVFKVKMN